MPRFGIYIAAALVLMAGISAVADAIVVTDEERMEEFVDSVTGRVSNKRIDSALLYAEPTQQSVEVIYNGRLDRFDGRNADRLRSEAREVLAPLEGSNLRLIQESIQVDGTRARVAVRVRTSEGLANAVFDLRRHDDRWLLRRVTVS